MKLGGFFSELLQCPVWLSSQLTFNEQNIFGICPKLKLLHSRPIEWDYLSRSCWKLWETEKLIWKLPSSSTTPLTVMYEIYCLNISVWNHKVCLFTSPEKTLACQLHSAGPVTEVAWYWTHVSYSVVNGVSSELCYSLAAKHTDCPLCVHNKCKTILHTVFVWHLELMEKIWNTASHWVMEF